MLLAQSGQNQPLTRLSSLNVTGTLKRNTRAFNNLISLDLSDRLN